IPAGDSLQGIARRRFASEGCDRRLMSKGREDKGCTTESTEVAETRTETESEWKAKAQDVGPPRWQSPQRPCRKQPGRTSVPPSTLLAEHHPVLLRRSILTSPTRKRVNLHSYQPDAQASDPPSPGAAAGDSLGATTRCGAITRLRFGLVRSDGSRP